jgi:hypothetical protein
MPKHPIRLISVNAGLVRGEPGLAADLDKTPCKRGGPCVF